MILDSFFVLLIIVLGFNIINILKLFNWVFNWNLEVSFCCEVKKFKKVGNDGVVVFNVCFD